MPPVQHYPLNELLKDRQKPEDLRSDNGLLQQFTKALGRVI